MTRSQFRDLVLRTLGDAVTAAHESLGTHVSPPSVVELHGTGCSGNRMNVEEALARLYLGEDRSYKVIDVAIKMTSDAPVIFVRASDHPPVAYENTWNAGTTGPFKYLGPMSRPGGNS